MTGMRRRRRCSSTARSTANRGSCWPRPRATAGSSSSIARPAGTSAAANTSRRTGRRASTRRAGRSPIPPRNRSTTARWCRRTKAVVRTGRRQASARAPVCSMPTPPAASACTTSTPTKTTRNRKGGAATIAADGRRQCCRRLTTRPGRLPGATSGPAAARSAPAS